MGQSPTASAADHSTWSSVPWTPVTDAAVDSPNINLIGWRKTQVPYLPFNQALALQTLDVWIPASSSSTDPPETPSLPSAANTWIIYIHGGAWRDPRITASSFTAAATHLLRRLRGSSTQNIAGLISLSYRLSSHPSYPKAPSEDASREARHPDHVADVLRGVAYFQRLVSSQQKQAQKQRYILTGHSCGATLAFQAVMDPARWGLEPGTVEIGKPNAIVGFNGLYDLAGFITAPAAGYEHLRDAYEQFTMGAFGDGEGSWRRVCPVTCGGAWPGEWTGGRSGKDGETGRRKLVVLVQSREDTLVPYQQLEGLRAYLEGEEGKGVEVRVMEAGGDHDDIWKEGRRMAEILFEVAQGLE